MSFETFGLLLGFAVYFVLIPACVFLHREERHRLRWRRQRWVRRAEDDPGGPFRAEGPHAREYLVEEQGAPRLVKVVVVTSLVLGHMFVPGLLAGIFGLVFYGVGLVSIPGLVLAARIYGNAFGLLRCELEAAKKARALSDFALTLNVVVVLLLVAMIFVFGEDFRPLAIFTLVYAAISMLHAKGLRRAAEEIEAVHEGPVVVDEPLAVPRAA